MDIAIVLYDRFTALDAIGPYEVLSRIPGANLRFLAEEPGPVKTDNGVLTVLAEHGLGELEHPDVVRRPGWPGRGRRPRRQPRAGVAPRRPRDEHLDDFGVHRLADPRRRRAAAGQARHLPLAGARSPKELGALPSEERVVYDGKLVTAAGRLRRDRHGPLAGRQDRRGHRRPGDPAGHRVRPPAALRQRLTAQGAPPRSWSCCAAAAATRTSSRRWRADPRPGARPARHSSHRLRRRPRRSRTRPAGPQAGR